MEISPTQLRRWSRYVRVRDGATCYLCGITAPMSRMDAHHIIPKSVRPDLALHLSNGVTLCDHCHVPVVHGGNTFDLGHCTRFFGMFDDYVMSGDVRLFDEEHQHRFGK